MTTSDPFEEADTVDPSWKTSAIEEIALRDGISITAARQYYESQREFFWDNRNGEL